MCGSSEFPPILHLSSAEIRFLVSFPEKKKGFSSFEKNKEFVLLMDSERVSAHFSPHLCGDSILSIVSGEKKGFSRFELRSYFVFE